jgi:hypothetical protein
MLWQATSLAGPAASPGTACGEAVRISNATTHNLHFMTQLYDHA